MKLFLFCLRYFLGFVVIAALGVAGLVALLKYDDSNDEKYGNEQLTPFIEDYTRDVGWLSNQVAATVATYHATPDADIDTNQLFTDWEQVSIHPIIEANHNGMYRFVWVSLMEVSGAIDSKEPIEVVEAKQRQFEHALWQALGAVKMSAHYRELGLIEQYYVQRDCEADVSLVVTSTKAYLDRGIAKVCRVTADSSTTSDQP